MQFHGSKDIMLEVKDEAAAEKKKRTPPGNRLSMDQLTTPN